MKLIFFIKTYPFITINIVISIFLFIFAGSFPDTVKKIYVLNEVKIDGSYLYLHRSDDSYNVMEFETKQVIVDGFVSYKYYNGSNIILWVLFILSIIITLVAILSDEVDFSDDYHRFLSNYVECICDNGYYYYRLQDRLLCKSGTSISSWDISPYVKDFIRNRKQFPVFKTIEETRNKQLKELGI